MGQGHDTPVLLDPQALCVYVAGNPVLGKTMDTLQQVLLLLS
jgi:hypothetical protein